MPTTQNYSSDFGSDWFPGLSVSSSQGAVCLGRHLGGQLLLYNREGIHFVADAFAARGADPGRPVRDTLQTRQFCR